MSLDIVKNKIEYYFPNVLVKIHDSEEESQYPFKDGSTHMDIFNISMGDLERLDSFIDDLQTNYIYNNNHIVCFHPWTEQETQELFLNEYTRLKLGQENHPNYEAANEQLALAA